MEVQALEAFRTADTSAAQALILGELNVRWDMLADAAKSNLVWKAIARKMGAQALRMNLNTLVRHGVLVNANGSPNREMVDYVVSRIADPDTIRRTRQFPYQFLSAYLNATNDVPQKVKLALSAAAEMACGNVPELSGPVVIGLDTSGSMSSPVTGWRSSGFNSKMRCVDAAALFAAAILRQNPESLIVPFDTQAYRTGIDPSDSILSIASRLAKYGGGGTDCSIPLKVANTQYRKRKFAGCVLVSDNQSWVGKGRYGSTCVMTQWKTFVNQQVRKGVKSPKLVCIDIQPYLSTQAPERNDILNIGGFSDAVFKVVASFMSGDSNTFVREVESMEL